MSRGYTRSKGELVKICSQKGYKYLKHYVGKYREKRIIFKDNVGYMYDSSPIMMLKDNFNPNPFDQRNPNTLKNISKWLILNKIPYKVLLSNKYVNAKTDLLFKCKKCKFVFKKTWDEIHHKKLGCDSCSRNVSTYQNSLGKNRKDLLKEWSSKNKVSPYSIKDNSSSVFIWKCKRCKSEWKTSINNRVIHKSGCPYCNSGRASKNYNIKKIFPHLMKEWDKTKNGNPEKYSPKSGKKVWWKCSKCGNEWKAVISSRTSGGKGCSACSSSRGEKKILEILLENKINFVKEYKFENCKNKRKLPFDFYLIDDNICIEYHGIQHYKSTEFFGGEKEFDKRKKNDKIKKKYCQDNGIRLIIIPYTKINKIDGILKQEGVI